MIFERSVLRELRTLTLKSVAPRPNLEFPGRAGPQPGHSKALWKRLVDTRTVPGDHDAVDGVEHVHKVVNIDQSPIGRNSRSNPATYIGFYDGIRELFTRAPLSVRERPRVSRPA